MDAESSRRHDGRGDNTFNGYGLLNGFGGDEHLLPVCIQPRLWRDGNDQMTGLDNFYDRLFGEAGDDVLMAMGQDVMDGGSGNDELYLSEPRLIRLPSNGLFRFGSGSWQCDRSRRSMADAVSIENFDLIGENPSHEDLEDELDEVSLRMILSTN